jgi:hypothetical protein
MSLNKKIGGQFERSPLGLQKSHRKEREVDPFAQLGSPGKKSKVGSALRSQYNFGEGRIKSGARGSSANGIPLFYGPCLPRSGYCV